MARKLAGDAQELTEHFAACTLSHKFRDARVVENVVEVEVDGVRTIQVVYFQAEAYPASPAMLMCNDDEQLNGELQALNDQFEEYAVFFDVFRALCGVLKLESDVQILDEMDASMAEIAADEENDGASDGSGSEAGFFDMGDDKDDVQLMREVLQKVSRWTKLEDKREHLENEHKAQAELDAGRGAYLPEVQTHLEEVASRNQIFNVREAFAMLSRELSDMMRDKSMPCTIDAVEDDAYHWEIAFKGFDPSSLLAQDLEELEQRHGQSAVVLRMEFKRGLHPFYPPAIRLLRPRCAAPLLGALSSHPMLRLRNWDPWRPQRDLIQQLRLFLQSHARICIESALNAPGVENAYQDIEKLLAKLEALTGVLPAGHQQFEAIYSGRLTGVDEQHLLALAPSNKRPKTADAHRRAWAAGTGYSSGHHSAGPVWDVQKARLAQSAQDAELKRVFSLLASAMAPRQSARSSARASAKPRSSERADMSSDEAAQAIRESCLVPFLEAELSQASFTDMGNRSMYYVDLLRVVSCLAVPKHASLLFTSQTPAAATEKGKTVFGNLCTLQRQASHFLSVLQASRHPTTPPVASAAAPQDEHAAAVEENAVKQMAERIIQTHKQAQSLEAGQRHGSATSDSQGPVAGSDEAYVAAMRPLQLGFLEGIARNHKYREKPRAEGAQPRPRTVRLGKEIASLSADLPLSPTSSVFVRVDEQNATLWRALITGPAGTPYSGGCFMFDIYFQPEYPSVPPLVLITTTGGGSVRFGPNLYNCGKVCLSLLGTWSGGRGEGWDLSVSTTLQVLVSIQSLIFVDEPYYCEPGFEAQMHTETGNKASKAYTLDIREQTMHWAIWQQMKSPPKGFEDVVRTHFKQRQKHVRETCQQWVDEATADNAACAPRMAKFLRDIKQELAKR